MISVPPHRKAGKLMIWSAMWKISGKNEHSFRSHSIRAPRLWVSANEYPPR